MAGLYIHIPFCRSKCAYCDFYSTRGSAAVQSDYVKAVAKELKYRDSELDESIDTIYVGGGTPSLLPFPIMSELLSIVNKWLEDTPIKEWTIEANPEDVTEEFLKLLGDFGVNRISIGIQSFDDELLRFVNRHHSSESALSALNLLTDRGWNYSADLIYGLPGQSLELWKSDLDTLLDFSPLHFSAYSLSVEPGTRLWAMMKSGKLGESSEDEVISMYEYLVAERQKRGYEHYEISNFSKPGCRSIHNSGYWESKPYIGVGAAAHSFDGDIRRFNPSSVKRYIEEIANKGFAFETEEETRVEKVNDYIFTSLRTSDGINVDYLNRHFPEFSAKIVSSMKDDCRLIEKDSRFYIPEGAYLLSDSIIRDLLL